MTPETGSLARSLLISWVLLGGVVPAVAAWTPLGPTGGPTLSVAIDPATPATVYVGVYTGGVYKSTDRGATWVPTGRGPRASYALAIDPSSPSTVYTCGYESVFRTTDGGATWTHVNPGLTHGETVYALALDVSTPSTVYAGSDGAGVFKSPDGGTTWAPIDTGLTDLSVYALAVDPVTPSVVYAGTESGVFRTVDGGATWQMQSAGLASTVRAITVDPSNSAVVFAGSDGGLFETTDGGASWVPSGASVMQRNVDALAIDPTDSTIVYAGTRFDGIFKTTDAGATWVRTPDSPSSVGLAIDPSRPGVIYSVLQDIWMTGNGGGFWARSDEGLHATDVLSLALDPTVPGKLVGTSYDQIVRTADDGVTWTTTTTPNIGLYEVALVPPRMDVVVAGERVTGWPAYWTHSTPVRWRPGRGLDTDIATSVVLDPSRPRTMYAGSYDDGIFKSHNGGRRWRHLPGSPLEVDVEALAVDPVTPRRVYAATSAGVSVTADGGVTWTPMNVGLANLPLDSVTIDPAHPATMYVGAWAENRVFKSIDGAATWTETSTGLPPQPVLEGGIIALLVDPLASSTVYVGTRGLGVLRSIDGGAIWSDFNAGLSVPSVTRLAVGPAAPSVIYAATSQGVFRLDP